MLIVRSLGRSTKPHPSVGKRKRQQKAPGNPSAALPGTEISTSESSQGGECRFGNRCSALYLSNY